MPIRLNLVTVPRFDHRMPINFSQLNPVLGTRYSICSGVGAIPDCQPVYLGLWHTGAGNRQIQVHVKVGDYGWLETPSTILPAGVIRYLRYSYFTAPANWSYELVATMQNIYSDLPFAKLFQLEVTPLVIGWAAGDLLEAAFYYLETNY